MKYTTTKKLEQLFAQALEHFPHPNLQSTGITQGELELTASGEVEYAEEFMFDAGILLDEPLTGGGWIEARDDTAEGLTITAFFGVVRNGDWRDGSILPPFNYVQGDYDSQTQQWELWIGEM